VPPFRNTGLFSDHFLAGEGRLESDPEWASPQGVAEVFACLQQEWSERADLLTEHTNESQTEEDWIWPVLRALGWDFEVQQPVRGVNRRPDYALVPSAQAKLDLQPLMGTDQVWEHVPVLADAKLWEQPLDRRRGDEEDRVWGVRGLLADVGTRPGRR